MSDNCGRPVRGHAVVLGASLAGLLAAVALARHADSVTIVERDRLPPGPQWRRGVPQARHAHNLMTAGHVAMERLLPGVRAQLYEAGMVRVRMPRDMLLLTAGGWMPRFTTNLAMMTSSRDLIDAVIRRRVADLPQVTLLEETEVLGLVAEPQASAVSGVRVRHRNRAAEGGWAAPQVLEADFVVDATGRTSCAPQWLSELGYTVPREAVVDAGTAYSTCVFAPPPGQADWNCILLQATPDMPVQGILNPIEDGRWMVSLAAFGGERPPTDHAGFLDYAKQLRAPELYEALRDAEPLTEVYASGRTENRRRYFERIRPWPDRFLVTGDAVCALNPSYGQGMSVSAISAVLIDDALQAAGTFTKVASGLRRKIGRPVGQAWQLATTADLAYPSAAKEAGWPTRLLISYLYRVLAASPHSRAASRALLDINQMISPPQAMFRPRVLAAALGGHRRAPSPAASAGTAPDSQPQPVDR